MNPKDKIGITKVPLSYLSGPSLVHEAAAMKNGADKYGRANWRDEPVTATIYIDAALRHIFSWLDGEEYAEDSGVHHLGHAKATLAIVLDAMEQDTLIDDRPTDGTTQDVLERLRADQEDRKVQYKPSSDNDNILPPQFQERVCWKYSHRDYWRPDGGCWKCEEAKIDNYGPIHRSQPTE